MRVIESVPEHFSGVDVNMVHLLGDSLYEVAWSDEQHVLLYFGQPFEEGSLVGEFA